MPRRFDKSCSLFLAGTGGGLRCNVERLLAQLAACQEALWEEGGQQGERFALDRCLQPG